ncbi:GntR family transcriptional regulator [Pseudoclavibacter endophyticus]|uniref:GntR family transcriptional regulator n=1 Tax=Pseudoclavibacter endophyticus TaxID=1778590 RepID=A0A6H9WNU1_9MICO|nr:GntR family transcriptional regulator [Pseudoclavibacter endophyticus]KAB1646759.1 GntR family transcriptional regulator [Pseudoclavibacter endophyticus]GGA75810.1 GntR family transcriptional regulator [Pseudoclavibacter endophyticus]
MELTDREPIYRQIAGQVREQIVAGALEEGERIMSTNEYAAAYRINPATASKAFAELAAEGLIERRRGLGMFVAEGARAKLVATGRERYEHETLAPAIRAGLALGLAGDEILASAGRLIASAGDTTASAPAHRQEETR